MPAGMLEIELDREAPHVHNLDILTRALTMAVVKHTVTACSQGAGLRAYLKNLVGSSSDAYDW